MPQLKAKQLAWLAGILAVGLFLLSMALSLGSVNANNLSEAVLGWLISFSFLGVGVIVAVRQPNNPIGWFLIAGILVASIGGFARFATAAALAQHPNAFSPIESLMVAIAHTSGTGNLSFGLMLFFTVLYFPTGKLPSRRWKWLPWLFALLLAVGFLLDILWPGPLNSFRAANNPLGIEPWAGLLMRMRSTLDIFLPLLFMTGVVAILIRYRSGGQVERQQIKWVFLAAIWGGIVFVIVPLANLFGVGNEGIYNLLFASFLVSLPITLGISVLRYRLWDIDVIIRKTLVYTGLTMALALVFFGLVTLLQQIFGRISRTENSPVAIVISTLLIAALFSPLRRRIQDFIDRRFYRKKYSAEQALEAFAETARSETDLEALTGKLVEVVSQTVQPERVTLWLKETK